MATEAFASGVLFARVDKTASPFVDHPLEEVNDLPSLGETVSEYQATHYQSTSHEYIGGLADGDEFTLQCNRVNETGSQQDILSGLKGTTQSFKCTVTRSNIPVPVSRTYEFDALVKGWSLNPNVDGINLISFTFKISDGITVA